MSFECEYPYTNCLRIIYLYIYYMKIIFY
uniref:(California timema) hypothetical protein n=1 Tax=Timema californicum TaxID=61474 RepID=A0A7R9JN28_TIMCA|nr:unnamed protein product [Timema californicum]